MLADEIGITFSAARLLSENLQASSTITGFGLASLPLRRRMPTRTDAGLHLWGDCRCFRPEVFFEDDPLLRDYEGLDP